jgi:hypothetical protein
MAIDGHRSTFPAVVDDWGSAFQNNSCQIVDAEWFNKIQDAAFTSEIKTRRTFLTGQTGVLQPVPSGSARPHIMFRAYTVTLTGSATTTKTATIPGPAFNLAEKQMFGGTPFASGNMLHIQIRKAAGDASIQVSYHCGLIRPTDTSGDSGFQVVASTARHGNGDTTISAGTYVVSLMLTNH